MNSSNSLRVLVFTAGVAAILTVMSLLIPKDGVSIGDVKLKFLSAEQIVSAKKHEKKDISSIVSKVNTEETKENELIKHKSIAKEGVGAPQVLNYEMNSASQFSLSSSGKNALWDFFKKLERAAVDKKKIHILHFGDSQIEGDRMTDFIRQRMQEKFGGYGPGLIAANNVYSTATFRQSYSSNFNRYTCFGGPKLKNKQYGVMNSAARFSPESVNLNSTVQNAWITIGTHRRANSRAQSFNKVKMFYNSCDVSCLLQVESNGKVIHEEYLVTDGNSHIVELVFGRTPESLKFNFKSVKSPNIVGFSCEGDYGVQVDNIAMRGSSGTFFRSVNINSFKKMLNELNTELTILQFGGNSMPYLKDSAAVRKAAIRFKSQIQTLKSLKPDMAILMIGPSDMSKLKNGVYETYPLLEYHISQLKKAALDAGAGYWNLFDAMGGKNSMPAWVEKDLGRTDHIHFRRKGATIAAQLFYDAFMSEYLKFEGK